MLFALFIHHKKLPNRVRPLKGSRSMYVPVRGSTPSIPNLSVEVPEGSMQNNSKGTLYYEKKCFCLNYGNHSNLIYLDVKIKDIGPLKTSAILASFHK